MERKSNRDKNRNPQEQKSTRHTDNVILHRHRLKFIGFGKIPYHPVEFYLQDSLNYLSKSKGPFSYCV